MRILIIEDEPGLGNLLKANLEAESYAVDVEGDGEKGLYRARTNDYDAIVLDDILPGKRGYEICRELRARGKNAPILLMSVQAESEWKVALLNDGADDYLTKPFTYAEMSARLRALLRRPRDLQGAEMQVGDLVLNESRSIVIRGVREIYLTTKEFSLLRYLMKNAGRIVSRAMLFEHVWNGEADPLSNMIETHIHNLRRKIDGKGERKLIRTIAGRGYVISDGV
jgi:DNA-binding response OmpR family regulator